MPALTDIPKALAACCATFGFNEEATITDSIAAPAAVVQPDDLFIEYLRTMGQEALYRFSITLLYLAINKDTAQNELAEYFSPGSALLQALEECVEGGVVTIVEARQMGTYEVGAARYFGARLLAQVRY